ncbi:MAG: hypothetical protein U1E65_11150 [Myxococcota bacterium]
MGEFLLGRVRMQTPPGYSLKLAVIAGPPEEPDTGYRKNLVIAEEPLLDKTGEEWLEQQLATMRQQMDGFALISRDTLSVRLHQAPVPLFEIRSQGPRGLMFSGLFAFAVDEDVVISLSCSHFSGPPFEAARAEFLGMIEAAVRSLGDRQEAR